MDGCITVNAAPVIGLLQSDHVPTPFHFGVLLKNRSYFPEAADQRRLPFPNDQQIALMRLPPKLVDDVTADNLP